MPDRPHDSWAVHRFGVETVQKASVRYPLVTMSFLTSVHVMPLGDLRVHTVVECSCGPRIRRIPLARMPFHAPAAAGLLDKRAMGVYEVVHRSESGREVLEAMEEELDC